MKIGRLALAGTLAGCLLSGCEEHRAEGEAAPAPRAARRFLPRDSSWIPESRVPRAPQETPRMVIWELSSTPDRSEPTPEERQAAEQLVADSFAAATRHGWFDFQHGRADGFRLLHGDKRHYYNQANILDDALLDANRPEFLMYYGTPRGQRLAGMMFYVRAPLEHGPELGGPLTRWHYHVWASPNCLLAGLLSVAPASAAGGCERGVAMNRSPEMLHVWLMEHPEGPFATTMWLGADQLQQLMERGDSLTQTSGAAAH